MTTKTFDFTTINGTEKITRTLRVIDRNGQPWFAATDVCKVLGRSNPTMAVKLLLDTERALIPNEGLGGNDLNIISEAGLYRLVMRSDKPVAKLFQDWVVRDVLPAIRKDGAYVSGEEKVATGEMSEEEFVLKAIAILQAKVERLSAENAVMSSELNLLTVDELRRLTSNSQSH